MKDNIKHELPPNWDAVVEKFPAVADQQKNVVFTYAPFIYVPGGQELPPDLYMHESIHLKQQGDDAQSWWDRYLTDADFRLDQELEAYGAQLAMFNYAGNARFEYEKNRLATDVSSALYGNMITYGEAVSQIRRIAKAIVYEG